jgi:hypothetical protein
MDGDMMRTHHIESTDKAARSSSAGTHAPQAGDPAW